MSTNSSTWDPSLCTLATCPVKEYGQLQYIPSLAGNAILLALFSVALVAQIGVGIKFKTWGYMAAMIGGLALEIVGYTGRIMLHNNIWDFNNFIIYLVGLTIGPAFFSAAIYLCLARIVSVYGEGLIRLKAKTITICFICADLVSLVLQAAGGAMASLADTEADSDTGVNIMIAGLASQVVATTAFSVICIWLMWSIKKNPGRVNSNTAAFRKRVAFRAFLIAIGIATVTILTRCVFRVAELSEGFGGKLANNEVLFMVLDGAMMVIAVAALTFAHPGPILGSVWQTGGFHLRSRKGARTARKEDAPLSGGSSFEYINDPQKEGHQTVQGVQS